MFGEGGVAGDPAGSYALAVRFTAAGETRWVRLIDARSAGDFDVARAVATDAAGNVYLTGDFESEESSDILVLSYDRDGNLRWRTLYDGPAGRRDSGRAIAVDASENVYVVGISEEEDGTFSMVTLRYSP